MSILTKKSRLSALLPKHTSWLEHFWFGVGILLFRINGFPEKDWRTPPTTTEEDNEGLKLASIARLKPLCW